MGAEPAVKRKAVRSSDSRRQAHDPLTTEAPYGSIAIGLEKAHQKLIAWIGYALDLAQHGKQADYAERMKGDLHDVIEIRTQNERRDSAFRGVYTVELGDTVYVLHAFQKKSTRGIATPKRELDLIRQHLKQAREHYEQQKQRIRH